MKKEMTLEQAGREMRDFAEMTAKYSQNWDNFEEIATKILTQAYEHGKGAPAK